MTVEKPINQYTRVLGIETSCDETSAAVVLNGTEVLSNIISSQVELHKPFGGVVPEVAARNHIECIDLIAKEALVLANTRLEEIDAYAVACGPGLVGALLVGVSYAKGLAYAAKKPLIGVRHLEAHICANYLSVDGHISQLKPPFVSLVVSGGHTGLYAVSGHNTYYFLGGTRDDAAGESFDKAARLLGFPYPGGPEIDKLAQSGDPTAIKFPRAKLGDANNLEFSFSGLKTAIMQYVKNNADFSPPDIAASFQKAVVDVLVDKTMKACEISGLNVVALAGGVAANNCLRNEMAAACQIRNYKLFIPEKIFCTDNAAMIACRGYYALKAGMRDAYDLNAYATGKIDKKDLLC